MQNRGRGKAAGVVNFVAKWLNLCLSTVLQNMSDHERNKLGLEKRYPFLLGPLEPLNGGRKPLIDRKLFKVYQVLVQFCAILLLMIVDYPSIVDI